MSWNLSGVDSKENFAIRIKLNALLPYSNGTNTILLKQGILN